MIHSYYQRIAAGKEVDLFTKSTVYVRDREMRYVHNSAATLFITEYYFDD